MAFTSLEFMAFVAVSVALYFLLPLRMRWLTLLAASLVFYWMNSGELLLVLLATTAFTYLTALAIQRSNDRGREALARLGASATRAEKRALRARTKRRSRLILAIGVVGVLGALLYLKYLGFFVSSLNDAFGAGLESHSLVLPLGISFYSLQAIAYLTDVYRNKVSADKNPVKLALFMSFFPQIVQGPIPRYKRLAAQLYEGHRFDYVRLCHGLQLALWGAFQKLVLADRLAMPVNALFEGWRSYHGPIVFFAAVLYGLQIYADFAGGVNIARGVAQIVGVELDQNFEQPYSSRSVEEFWRRWHITLGAWMKDYVFYPLSLSKLFVNISRRSRRFLGDFVGKRLPPIMAMFIVYFLVGFWHGPDWKYVVYGVWNGVFITLGILLGEKYAYLVRLLRFEPDSLGWRSFQTARTFCICSLGRLFSRGISLPAAWGMLTSLAVGWYDFSWVTDGTLLGLGLDVPNWIMACCAVGVVLFVDSLHERGVRIRETIDEQHIVFRWLVYYAAILAVVVFGVWGPAYDASAFIYGQF